LSVGAVAVLASLALTVLTPDDANRNGTMPQPSVTPTPGRIIEGTVTHVRDGDTIELRGVAMRLADLDCAELGTAAGARALQAVTALTAGKTLLCRLTGAQTYDRWVATCTLPDGRTLSQAMIAGGHCARY
jgi:endonuclease YncB( thermonuclease family)